MAVNVASIYENTIRPGHPYCRICFRTATETKLVKANNILQFADAVKLNIFDTKKKAACYYCEALAGTALRLYQACVNAVSIRTICQPLKNMKPDDQVPNWIRSAIKGCNANLKEYREKSKLQQTEVLVVDSSGIEWQSENSSEQRTRIDAPSVAPQIHTYPTVVVDDDDDAPLGQKNAEAQTIPELPKLVPVETLLDPKYINRPNIASLLPSHMKIISRHATDANNFIVHPVVLADNGSLVAPSLAAEIRNGQLIFNGKLFQQLPLIDATIKRCIIQDPAGWSNRTFTKNVGDSLLSRNDDVEFISEINNLRNGFSRTNVSENSNASQNIRMVAVETILKNILSDNEDNNAAKKRMSVENSSDCAKRISKTYLVDLDTVNGLIFNNNIEQNPIAVISNVVSECKNVTSVDIVEVKETAAPKRPGLVEKVGKIDWEDKIPMDVISFVDATDPNGRELIVPDPLAPSSPSNVHPPRKKPKQDYPDPLVTIDLC